MLRLPYTMRKLREVLDTFRHLFDGKRDFKRFLQEAPDFMQLELDRSSETGREPA